VATCESQAHKSVSLSKARMFEGGYGPKPCIQGHVGRVSLGSTDRCSTGGGGLAIINCSKPLIGRACLDFMEPHLPRPTEDGPEFDRRVEQTMENEHEPRPDSSKASLLRSIHATPRHPSRHHLPHGPGRAENFNQIPILVCFQQALKLVVAEMQSCGRCAARRPLFLGSPEYSKNVLLLCTAVS
jgi:hypothetical protein